MFGELGNIREIQIDHTSRCNLSCAQCARTDNGWSADPKNKNLDLTLDDYKILLAPFSENTISLFHCGNYGDALASPSFDETFLYSLSRKPLRITVATNGSLKPASWWADFAREGGERLQVTFAIDGLEDTNAIYREGANWKRLMENVKAFIGAGGNARWDFIEFQHNYHQIEEAEKLAVDLGFKKFNVKYTARFASLGKKSETTKSGKALLDTQDNVNQKDLRDISVQYASFEEYARKTPITCKTKIEKKIFVDMHMRLWPCCWFGAPLYFKKNNIQKRDFDHLVNLYGMDFNNMRIHGWSVLEHEFFQAYLENSWNKPDEKFKRIYTCGRTCGEKFEFSSGYGKNSHIRRIENSNGCAI